MDKGDHQILHSGFSIDTLETGYSVLGETASIHGLNTGTRAFS
jgi:hypothetical protein